MTDIQLYLAIGVPMLAVLASLTVSLFQISGVREDMRGMREEMRAGDASLRAEMHARDAALRDEIKLLRVEIREDMQALRADLHELRAVIHGILTR